MTSLLFVCLSSLLLLLMVMLFLLGALLACRPYFIGVVENGHDSFEGRERWSIYPTSVLQPPVMFHFTTPNTIYSPCLCLRYCLAATPPRCLVVKASTSGAEDPRFESRLKRDFFGSSHISDLKIGTPVATLPSAWHYRFSAGTGRSGVSIL